MIHRVLSNDSGEAIEVEGDIDLTNDQVMSLIREYPASFIIDESRPDPHGLRIVQVIDDEDGVFTAPLDPYSEDYFEQWIAHYGYNEIAR